MLKKMSSVFVLHPQLLVALEVLLKAQTEPSLQLRDCGFNPEASELLRTQSFSPWLPGPMESSRHRVGRKQDWR